MPLTGKIPKLDTQKLFDEMVVLESEVAGIIDGSLGQLRDVDKTDEYWEIYTTRLANICLLYTSPSPRDAHESRMPSSA